MHIWKIMKILDAKKPIWNYHKTNQTSLHVSDYNEGCLSLAEPLSFEGDWQQPLLPSLVAKKVNSSCSCYGSFAKRTNIVWIVVLSSKGLCFEGSHDCEHKSHIYTLSLTFLWSLTTLFDICGNEDVSPKAISSSLFCDNTIEDSVEMVLKILCYTHTIQRNLYLYWYRQIITIIHYTQYYIVHCSAPEQG